MWLSLGYISASPAIKCIHQVAISEVKVHSMKENRENGDAAPQILYLAIKLPRV